MLDLVIMSYILLAWLVMAKSFFSQEEKQSRDWAKLCTRSKDTAASASEASWIQAMQPDFNRMGAKQFQPSLRSENSRRLSRRIISFLDRTLLCMKS